MSTILIVADDEFISTLLCEVLSADGHTTYIAPSADRALSILRAHSEIDLLFTDIRIPGAMSGFTLAQEAKRLRPSLSVLYATNWPVEPPGSNLPAHLGILKKPYGLGHLRSRVRAMTA